jgi:hypothetical protein
VCDAQLRQSTSRQAKRTHIKDMQRLQRVVYTIQHCMCVDEFAVLTWRFFIWGDGLCYPNALLHLVARWKINVKSSTRNFKPMLDGQSIFKNKLSKKAPDGRLSPVLPPSDISP